MKALHLTIGYLVLAVFALVITPVVVPLVLILCIVAAVFWLCDRIGRGLACVCNFLTECACSAFGFTVGRRKHL